MKNRLTYAERMLLVELARADGFVRTGQLVYAVWQGLDEPDTSHNIIRVHIMSLRKKIGFCGLRIVSQPYSGYRLEVNYD